MHSIQHASFYVLQKRLNHTLTFLTFCFIDPLDELLFFFIHSVVDFSCFSGWNALLFLFPLLGQDLNSTLSLYTTSIPILFGHAEHFLTCQVFLGG